MENPRDNQFENKENAVELNVVYGLDQEIERVKNTLERLPWYTQQSYKVELPANISDQSSPEEIASSIASEYSEAGYEDFARWIKEQWPQIPAGFEELKKIPSFHLKDAYTVFLTKYGTGGSYDALSGKVIVNIETRGKEKIIGTLVHEIIHTGIEHLIVSCDVRHWYKERLVDLIGEKYFPGLTPIQHIGEDTTVIDNAFEKHFPDIEAIAREIGEAK